MTVLVAMTVACSQPEIPYNDEMAAWRAEKDAFMRSSTESPVPPEQRPTFAPLEYFGVAPDYRVPASLEVIQSDDVLEMPTSTGLRRRMRRIGRLAFTLKGEPLTLTAFVDASAPDTRRLFVPFGDVTNGTETYTGGRYIDLDRTATGIYDLDFNRAYFPFCYYNEKYDCPLPPRENKLKVPIRAGEKIEDRR